MLTTGSLILLHLAALCIHTVDCVFQDSSDENEELFDEFGLIKEFCPLIQNCNGMPEESFTHEVIPNCCKNHCACDENCFVRGDCCYDIEKTRAQEARSVTTDGRSCIRNVMSCGIKDKLVEPITTMSYLLVTTCSQFYDHSTEDIDNCLGSTDIASLTPVYSRDSRRSYRNIYCAVCNADGNNTTPFDFMMYCDSAILEFDDEMFINEMSRMSVLIDMACNEQCVVYINPPYDVEVTSCIHPETVVSDCDFEDEDFSTYHDFCQYDYVPFSYHGIIYRNSYCTVCNIREEVNPDLCVLPYYDSQSITILLNFRPEPDQLLLQEYTNELCNEDESFVEDTVIFTKYCQ